MRHPKSTSNSSPFVVAARARAALVAFAAKAAPVALAGVALLASCVQPGHNETGAGGTSATTGSAGTVGSGGTTAGGGVSGTSGGGRGGAGGTSATAGTGGPATGTGGGGGGGVTGGGTAGGGSGGIAGGTAGGGNGGGGMGGMKPPRGPTPAANGVNFPFPQNREMSRCTYPVNYLNQDVTDAYTKWKTDLVTSNGAGGARRVQRTSTDPVSTSTPAMSTVSEGIGYGMLIAVYMGAKDDQMLFDDLWNYSQKHKNANGLMNWSISADGNMTPGLGAATDADEDIAFALLMADKQWGSAGTLNYLNLAKAQINNIWLHEIVDSKLAGPGDGWGPTNLWGDINISYFAPFYYRLFKTVDSGHDWDAVIKTSYDTIMYALTTQNGNANNGLVPAWCASNTNSSGVTTISASAPPNNIFYYQYDSCRTPFRIALDWCLFGETRAQAYLMKTGSFFSGIGAANIVDGYDLNGNKHVQFSPANTAPTLAQQSAAFLGPAGVGAMVSSTYLQFINDSYARVATRQTLVGGAYYDESWIVMSLLMMTGNFLDYTAIQPAH